MSLQDAFAKRGKSKKNKKNKKAKKPNKKPVADKINLNEQDGQEAQSEAGQEEAVDDYYDYEGAPEDGGYGPENDDDEDNDNDDDDSSDDNDDSDDSDDEEDDSSSEEEEEPDWLKEELIATRTRARWGETAASAGSKASAADGEAQGIEEIVEDIDGQSSQIQMDHEADFCYSASASRNFPDYYDDEYGDAVETSLRELKDEFGETYDKK